MAGKDSTTGNQNEIPEKDINDAFDSIVFSEQLISNESFQEGLIKGKKDGKLEGYHLGFHKGLELGTEIGFYRGITKVLTDNLSELTVEKNEKIQSSLEKLIHLLDEFPKHNDDDIVNKMNNVRACFKKLISLLKLNISFPITSATSF